MRIPVLLALAVLAAASDREESARQRAKNSAVKKVVEMMNDMVAKGKREKQEEKIRFAAFKQFCESTSKEKVKAISESEAMADDLSANIADAKAEIMTLGKEIAGHQADLATATDEKNKATADREKEHADFEVMHKDYTDSISAVERAQEKIKESSGGELSFAQQKTALQHLSQYVVPDDARRAIQSYLLQTDDSAEDGSELAAPQAAVFESQSGGILTMVENMGEKFEDKLAEIEKQEMNKNSAFNMLAADLVDQIESATKQTDKKTSRKKMLEEQKAANEGDLKETNFDMAEDKKFLADLDLECRQKSVDFEKRQEMRQGELDAINKAIEIMTSDDITGGTQHLDLYQKAAALMQLRSVSVSPMQGNVADFLQGRAASAQSRLLSLIAARVENSPFDKVNKMIRDMIQKLMEEANEEAEHKAFCDAEMGTNKHTRDAKTDESASLKADIDKLTADIQQLANEMSMLTDEIAAIDAAVAKATAEREAEKEKNTTTLNDSKAAQEATQQALQVLKDFYAGMADAAAAPKEPLEAEGPIKYDLRALAIIKKATGEAALLQQGAKPVQGKPAASTLSEYQTYMAAHPKENRFMALAHLAHHESAGTVLLQDKSEVKTKVPGAPEMEEGAYTGMGEGGIVGLLEVIESDFARLIADTDSAEAEAKNEFQTFMDDSSEDKAVKEMDMKNKAASKTNKEGDLLDTKKDLKTTEMELEAAMDYFEKLKPSCVEQGVSFEERVAKRKEEIESLQEALKMLTP